MSVNTTSNVKGLEGVIVIIYVILLIVAASALAFVGRRSKTVFSMSTGFMLGAACVTYVVNVANILMGEWRGSLFGDDTRLFWFAKPLGFFPAALLTGILPFLPYRITQAGLGVIQGLTFAAQFCIKLYFWLDSSFEEACYMKSFGLTVMALSPVMAGLFGLLTFRFPHPFLIMGWSVYSGCFMLSNFVYIPFYCAEGRDWLYYLIMVLLFAICLLVQKFLGNGKMSEEDELAEQSNSSTINCI